MTAGGRVSRLDGLHRGVHEALEDPAQLGIEQRVLEGDGGLRGERLAELG